MASALTSNVCLHDRVITSLHLLCSYSFCKVAIHKGEGLSYCELLLAAGASPNSWDVWGHTPLMTLIWKALQEGNDVSDNDLKLSHLLVGAGCDVDQVSGGHQWQGTALLMAVENNCFRMVKFLLSAGADPDISAGHLSPLHLSAGTNNLQMAKYLLNANCSMDLKQEVIIRNDTGMTLTPFGYALYKGHVDLAKMIVHAGYDLKEENYLWAGGDIPEILLSNPDLWIWLQGRSCNPHSLLFLCQTSLRISLGTNIEKSASELPLPNSMKDAISLNNFLNENVEADRVAVM